MTIASPALPWLLEPDDPGVRYLALRDLSGLPPGDRELVRAKQAAYSEGPISTVLKHMNPEGFWRIPGGGYNPKYSSTVWSLILLSQLGASAGDDRRITKACKYYLDHAVSKADSISYNGTPSGVIDCLQGNMCAALTGMDYADDRLDRAYDWMARSVTGDGVKYYAYKCGPGFACGPNGKLPCAWGAVKVMLAFGKLPEKRRTPSIRKAIGTGADFLLGSDPVKADYPTRGGIKPSRNWWKFGFPVFYVTDILQIAEALVSLGYGNDPRLNNAVGFIRSKQDGQGRWILEYDYSGKTWGNFGEKNRPNKWVTYRALKILKLAGAA
ncbi:hypothetical protein A2Z33_06055 [Candidatus Gottesmanbacteria bacterium RBG_16_52_11]|uniref:Nitrogen fixation protein NifH n=1 Tax=Candidatus Gottesmanbacteria bacterium RBG_16_52_11 TaxID=1798374 RepID=A0A1F5YXD0_9BACT|nr:MAG: hypothetical protein A2Z33_06055 [Candidatus Gottesmanbacteria bacterium RBG_16_52_11]